MSKFKLELPAIDYTQKGITTPEAFGLSRATERTLDALVREAYKESDNIMEAINKVVESDAVTTLEELVYTILEVGAIKGHNCSCHGGIPVAAMKLGGLSSFLDMLMGKTKTEADAGGEEA